MAAQPLGPGTRVGRVDLRVTDVGRALGFYRDVLGFAAESPRPPDAGDESMTLAAGGPPVLRLVDGAPAGIPASGATGLFHTAFLYPTRADLADALGRVAAAGLRLTGASDHGVSEALYLRDPDGNGVELYADRPLADWPRRPDGGIDMYTAPLDLADLVAAGGERARFPSPGAPVPAGTTVGHVHLKVADVDRATRFYVDEVGLALMAGMPQAAFLAGGGYHHHVGANTWMTLGGAPPPPGSAGLERFELRVPAGAEARTLRDPDGIEVVVVPDPAG
jgi:catechol 2,3-dioxygenase